MTFARLLAPAALLLCLAGVPVAADDASDQAAILALLNAQFDKPDNRLSVAPIAVEDGFAVASWSQGDMGGRAFLRRHGEGWMLVLCSGDALKAAATLEQVGMPADSAARLAAELAEGEQAVDPERVALFSRFEGMVMMGEGGEHPPVGDHQHHHQTQ